MDNKGVLIGSIIFVFGSFILMIVMMLYESNKAYKMKELAQSVKTESRPATTNVPSGLSRLTSSSATRIRATAPRSAYARTSKAASKRSAGIYCPARITRRKTPH